MRLTVLFSLLSMTIGAAPASRPASQPAGKRVVYVIDVGVSVQPHLERVKEEVYKGITNLPAGAQFNIVLASPVGAMSFDESRSLMPATRKNLDLVGDFLDRMLAFKFEDDQPHQPAAVTDAMMIAMRAKPDTVWLVSDGRVMTNGIVKSVRLSNSRKLAKVNALVVGLHGKPLDNTHSTAAGRMLNVATENGGRCIDADGKEVNAEALKKTVDEKNAEERRDTRPSGPSILD